MRTVKLPPTFQKYRLVYGHERQPEFDVRHDCSAGICIALCSYIAEGSLTASDQCS